jgi:hypothetical protein
MFNHESSIPAYHFDGKIIFGGIRQANPEIILDTTRYAFQIPCFSNQKKITR